MTIPDVECTRDDIAGRALEWRKVAVWWTSAAVITVRAVVRGKMNVGGLETEK